MTNIKPFTRLNPHFSIEFFLDFCRYEIRGIDERS